MGTIVHPTIPTLRIRHSAAGSTFGIEQLQPSTSRALRSGRGIDSDCHLNASRKALAQMTPSGTSLDCRGPEAPPILTQIIELQDDIPMITRKRADGPPIHGSSPLCVGRRRTAWSRPPPVHRGDHHPRAAANCRGFPAGRPSHHACSCRSHRSWPTSCERGDPDDVRSIRPTRVVRSGTGGPQLSELRDHRRRQSSASTECGR